MRAPGRGPFQTFEVGAGARLIRRGLRTVVIDPSSPLYPRTKSPKGVLELSKSVARDSVARAERGSALAWLLPPLKVDVPTRWKSAPIPVLGDGRLARGVTASLRTLGLSARVLKSAAGLTQAHVRKAPVVVVALEGATYAQLQRLSEACLAAHRPCLFLCPEEEEVLLGPMIHPGLHGDFLGFRRALLVQTSGGGALGPEDLDHNLPQFVVGRSQDLEPWVLSCAQQLAGKLVVEALGRPPSRVMKALVIRPEPPALLPFSAPVAPPKATAGRHPGAIPDGRNMGLIVGSQRSGTTMLGAQLDRRCKLTYFDEPASYQELEALTPRATGGFALFKIPTWTAELSFLQHHFPRARYIYLSRPMLQVVGSMMALRNFTGESWAEVFAQEEARTALMLLPDRALAARLTQELSQLREPHEVAGFCAFLKTAYVRYYRQTNLALLELAYDELVEQPEESIDRVIDFLGCRRRTALQVAPARVLIGQTSTDRRIDTKSREKYKQVLSPEQIHRLEALEARWRASLAMADANAVMPPHSANST